MKHLVLSTLGAGLLVAAASVSTPAQAMPTAPLGGVTAGSDLITSVQYRGRHWGGRSWGGPRYYGGYGGSRYYGRRNNVGPAIGAGILGLATGAIVGGALAQQQPQTYYEPGYQTYVEPGYTTGTVVQGTTQADVAYCMNRFKSYDPASGTYLGYDGLRHPCP